MKMFLLGIAKKRKSFKVTMKANIVAYIMLARIQSLKKSVPKGDRNRRNAVQQEINAMEKELAERHAKELKELYSSLEACSISAPGKFEIFVIMASLESVTSSQDAVLPVPRVSKAAKRREKAAAKARSLNMAMEETLIKSASSTSALEYSQLERALSDRGLTLHNVCFVFIGTYMYLKLL